MKKNKIRPIVYSLGLVLFLASCSEQTKATFDVFGQKLEAKLTKLAGEGQVALQMHRNRHAKLKMALVRIKTAVASTNRKLQRKQEELDALSLSETASRKSIESLIATYESHLKKLVKAEEEGVKALAASVEGYKVLKIRITTLEEQIDAAKAMGHFETTLDPGATSTEVKELIEKMEHDLDTAEATLAVGELDLDL